MKTLVIFDFDDTLFKTGALIGVSRRGSDKKFLTSHEYATYVPHEEEEFDYEQFHIYPPKPEPIRKSAQQFKSAVNNHGERNVIILTARSNPAPVQSVLKNFGMAPVEILAIGSSDPERKADEVEKLVNERSYSSVIVYEDSKKNIDAIRQRMNYHSAEIHFQAFLVKATTREKIIQYETKQLPKAIRTALKA
jgi:phosphoglycolate phosphatase-like HAD superfamily hydrolase